MVLHTGRVYRPSTRLESASDLLRLASSVAEASRRRLVRRDRFPRLQRVDRCPNRFARLHVAEVNEARHDSHVREPTHEVTPPPEQHEFTDRHHRKTTSRS